MVAREVDKLVKPSIENMRIHFAKKLGDEMLRSDTSLREIKSNNKGSKKSKNDTIKQITIIVVGALLVGLMPSIFQFIAEALKK